MKTIILFLFSSLIDASIPENHYFEADNSENQNIPNINQSTVVENTFPKLLFKLNDEVYWTEFNGTLWKSNVTNDTVQVLNDSNKIVASIRSPEFSDRVIFNNQIFYDRVSQSIGGQLWKTDGTASGTAMVKRLFEPEDYFWVNIANYRIFNDKLLFTTRTSSGFSLWVSDGSNAGTFILTNYEINISYMAELNGSLIFMTSNGENKMLWSTDGTIEGTKPFFDLQGHSWSSINLNNIVFNNEVYFTFENVDRVVELWKTDGIASGTSFVKSIGPITESPVHDDYHYIVHNNLLYFVATDEQSGWEIWVTDGSNGGTILLKDINDTEPGAGSYPANFFFYKDTMFFTAIDGVNGRKLWTTEGTAESTMMHSSLLLLPDNSTADDSPNGYRFDLKLEIMDMNDDRILFWVNNSEGEPEIWELKDKTTPATLLFTGGEYDRISEFNMLNEKDAFFIKRYYRISLMRPVDSPDELWFMSGDDNSFHFIKNLTDKGNMGSLVMIEDQYFFRGNDEVNSYDLSKFHFENYVSLENISGSWYNSETPGHGIFLEKLNGSQNENDRLNMYWFTHHDSNPVWVGGVGEIIEGQPISIDLHIADGTNFPPDFNTQDVNLTQWGQATLDFETANSMNLNWSANASEFGTGSIELIQLSEISDLQKGCYSGSFYNPDQSGHGLFIHMTDNNQQDQINVAWFVNHDGQQFWLVGSGILSANNMAMIELNQFNGASFFDPLANDGWSFDPEDLINSQWGSLSLTYLDNNNISFEYMPDNSNEFQNGELNMTRLTEIQGHVCE